MAKLHGFFLLHNSYPRQRVYLCHSTLTTHLRSEKFVENLLNLLIKVIGSSEFMIKTCKLLIISAKENLM